ncbi:hypothetical protein HN419_04250 [Candidatus Woesearchaeota archaeon]|jgi:FKBP-type peptidyl-prolyl cis-trans isomerase 2|nr:hypothetical protein [Candidatus Woesearchaeota archaeon]MBT3537911.1 hypothetical protein [Candidatus Woesearchaeota archaeon]MBT4698049.1 hypothetical protein [Candidatus Woesearchaeota archaeon]MBT4716950.1 hypothetical protein [Candidatus Woesearchaeota archaeon]MBT7105580.1 hypothetical protein [Candidatus Woesearchaeota archaeon]
MTNTIKKGDFVELEYTGAIKDPELVFDTTSESVAKKNNIFDPKTIYGPVIVCVGEKQVLAGMDAQLEGKGSDVEFPIKIAPEGGFGKKESKLIQLIPTNKFTKEGIRPAPGLQVNIDGTIATIKNVSGGRTLVDFNHPLAGQDLYYKIKVIRKVEDKVEQINAFISISLNIKAELLTTTYDKEKDEAKVIMKTDAEVPKEVFDQLSEKIKEVVKVKNLEVTAQNK